MREDRPAARVRQGLLPRGETRAPPLPELGPRVDAHKDGPWCLQWTWLGDMGGRGEDDNACEHGWVGEGCDSETESLRSQIVKLSVLFLPFDVSCVCVCVSCRAMSPPCLRTTLPVLRSTLRGLSSVCGTPQVNCCRCLFVCVCVYVCRPPHAWLGVKKLIQLCLC